MKANSEDPDEIPHYYTVYQCNIFGCLTHMGKYAYVKRVIKKETLEQGHSRES